MVFCQIPVQKVASQIAIMKDDNLPSAPCFDNCRPVQLKKNIFECLNVKELYFFYWKQVRFSGTFFPACVLSPLLAAKGRTNVELREQFTLASGVSQSMTPFKSKAPREASSPTSSVSGDTRNGGMQGPITKVGFAPGHNQSVRQPGS